MAIVLILFVPLSSTEADEEMALQRLMNIVSVLQELGDEILGEPVTGTFTPSLLAITSHWLRILTLRGSGIS